MEPVTLRLFTTVLLLFPPCSFATAIMVRSDGKEVAVAADSKRRGTSSPACKIRRVTGGVFFAAGETITEISGPPPFSFDAYEFGSRSGDEGGTPREMIERFTASVDNSLKTVVAFLAITHDPRVAKWTVGSTGGPSILQAGYATYARGEPSFYVRSFVPVVTLSRTGDVPQDIRFVQVNSCPIGCADASTGSSDTNYTPLGSPIMEAWARSEPSLYNKGPMDFVTALVGRAADKLPKVGRPLTRVSLTGDDKVNWVEIGACTDEAKKDSSPKNKASPKRKSSP